MRPRAVGAIVFGALFVQASAAQPADVGAVELVLSDPVFDGVTTPPWMAAAAVLGGLVVVVVAVLLIAWARGAKIGDKERAFELLSRRLGLGKEMREVLAQAATCYGCAPVALLISERALREAVLAYQSTPEGRARPAQIDRVQRQLLAN